MVRTGSSSSVSNEWLIEKPFDLTEEETPGVDSTVNLRRTRRGRWELQQKLEQAPCGSGLRGRGSAARPQYGVWVL